MIDKKAEQLLNIRMIAVGDWGANNNFVLPGQTEQQHLENGQQGDEQCCFMAVGGCANEI